MNRLKAMSSLLKGRGHDKAHMTLTQEINGQWKILLSINRL